MTIREKLRLLEEKHALSSLVMAEQLRSLLPCSCHLLRHRDVRPCTHCRCDRYLTEAFAMLDASHESRVGGGHA